MVHIGSSEIDEPMQFGLLLAVDYDARGQVPQISLPVFV
jgi:hypothetical protein